MNGLRSLKRKKSQGQESLEIGAGGCGNRRRKHNNGDEKREIGLVIVGTAHKKGKRLKKLKGKCLKHNKRPVRNGRRPEQKSKLVGRGEGILEAVVSAKQQYIGEPSKAPPTREQTKKKKTKTQKQKTPPKKTPTNNSKQKEPPRDQKPTSPPQTKKTKQNKTDTYKKQPQVPENKRERFRSASFIRRDKVGMMCASRMKAEKSSGSCFLKIKERACVGVRPAN